MTIPSNTQFENILDFYYKSGMTSKEFARIADRLAVSSEETLTGLINVNTASKEVLMCLPGLEEKDAEALIEHRKKSGTDLSSIAWVVDALDQDKAVAIGSYITAKSVQYSVDVVAVSGNGRAFRRAKAVLDPTQSTKKMMYWKSMTYLGWPLDREILTTLRSGESLNK